MYTKRKTENINFTPHISKPNIIMKRYVIYIRVSTRKQGASGLGLEAQRQMCLSYIKAANGE